MKMYTTESLFLLPDSSLMSVGDESVNVDQIMAVTDKQPKLWADAQAPTKYNGSTITYIFAGAHFIATPKTAAVVLQEIKDAQK